MRRSGGLTTGDLVRLANTSPMHPNRPGIFVKQRVTGFVTVRWLNGNVSIAVPVWDVHPETVENLSEEELAALMLLNLKGQV